MAKKLFVTLAAVALSLFAIHLTLQFLNLRVYHEKQGQVFEISNRVDVDDENSIPSWYSQFLLLSIAVAAFAVAWLESDKNVSRAWKLIGLVGLLFSIDEVSGLHEFVLQTVYLIFYGVRPASLMDNAWWIVLPFIAAAGLGLLWWLYRLLPRRTVVLFLIGGITYVAGGAGFEIAGGEFVKTSFMYQGVITGMEEVLEMLGSIIVLYTILDYLETHYGQRLKTAAKQLSIRS